VDIEDYIPRTMIVASPSVIYRNTDSFVRPRKGIVCSAIMDISKGISSDLDDFFKYRFEGRYYVTTMDRITLAVRGRYGFIDPYNEQQRVPEDQLFFLGGTSDVRGFDENKLRFDFKGDGVGGRESVVGNVEARINLLLNFEFTLFYDIGTIRKTRVDQGSDDWRSSAGLGLQYITAIGPIGFMYGHKLDRKEGESSGRFHFSLGYTF
jgi:outer membrane protein insertion porin family